MPQDRNQKSSSDFSAFFDKVSWFAITAVAIYVATQLNKMSDSVTNLNQNIAVMVQKIQYTEKTLDEHGQEIRLIKEKVYGGRR